MDAPTDSLSGPRVAAVIVAAGSGTRMGPGVDKLFLEVAGRPIVAHTWGRFEAAPMIDELVLVVREGMQAEFHQLAANYHFQKPYRLAVGGKERQDSVWNGLLAVRADCGIVAIQDGARPCTSRAVIEATIQAAREMGAAVAAQRVTDTIKESDGGTLVARHIDRARLWAVQTPQTFRVEVIRRALAAVRERGLLVTDDTAACELIGQPVKLVEGREPNPKATSPADLPYLGLLLERMNG
ncbi:MAG: 2-C-methyl-D-erythritol 4-phosphate cytidylyltransferase [Pedosphaera sp. Tous-C6FEB]|nr:MAG: 2-C-methyl-D-erythritol 4-phosphate cytidylyltransferase [Pedosphaera sp. Tous-C6FEB]